MSLVNLRPYRPEDAPEVRRLLRDVWGQNLAEAVWRNWDWQFARHPLAPKDGSHVMVLDHEGVAAALICFIPTRAQLGGRPVTVQWTGHIMARPDRRGYGLHVLRHAVRREGLTLGFPNDASAAVLLRMDGPIPLTAMRKRLCVLDPGALAAARLRGASPRFAARLAGAPWRGVVRALLLANSRRRPHLCVEEAETFSPEFDAFWDRVSPGWGNLVVRDAAYLTWRFRDCPACGYRILVARENGRMIGYLVFRTQEEAAFRRGLVVDMLVAMDDRAALAALLSEALIRMSREGVALAMCPLSTSSPRFCFDVLWRCGFFFGKAGRRLIGNRIGAEKSGIYTNDLPSAWYLTLGDSDQDMT